MPRKYNNNDNDGGDDDDDDDNDDRVSHAENANEEQTEKDDTKDKTVGFSDLQLGPRTGNKKVKNATKETLVRQKLEQKEAEHNHEEDRS